MANGLTHIGEILSSIMPKYEGYKTYADLNLTYGSGEVTVSDDGKQFGYEIKKPDGSIFASDSGFPNAGKARMEATKEANHMIQQSHQESKTRIGSLLTTLSEATSGYVVQCDAFYQTKKGVWPKDLEDGNNAEHIWSEDVKNAVIYSTHAAAQSEIEKAAKADSDFDKSDFEVIEVELEDGDIVTEGQLPQKDVDKVVAAFRQAAKDLEGDDAEGSAEQIKSQNAAFDLAAELGWEADDDSAFEQAIHKASMPEVVAKGLEFFLKWANYSAGNSGPVVFKGFK